MKQIKERVGLTGALSLLLLSSTLNGQDPITGIYNWLGHPLYEVVFQINGQFQFTRQGFNSGRTFHGTWVRVNDSTIKAQSDTTIFHGVVDKTVLINEFYCIQSKDDTGLISCHFRYVDTLDSDTGKFRVWFYKKASFHLTGGLLQHTNYFKPNIKVVTTFYPNGNIKEIIEYKRDVKHGINLFYYSDGTLNKVLYWRKGKIKKYFLCPNCLYP